MNTSNPISLSINELVASLALCGYDRPASQIINDQNLIQDDAQFERFIEQSEQLLKQRGYWDDTKDTKLVLGLENTIRLLVNCTKKVRIVYGDRVLNIHLLNDKYALIQDVNDQMHHFTYFKHTGDYNDMINELINSPEENANHLDDYQTVELTSNVFDQLHTIDQSVLQAMISDSDLNDSFRKFLKDFQNNEQRLDNISFLTTNYVKDQTTTDQVVFMLPSDQLVWHIDYEKVSEDKIFIVPVPQDVYTAKINETIQSFFQLKITADQK